MSISTIPANLFVNVQPSVLGAGGNALNIIGLILTTSNRVPVGSVYSFASAAAVANFFGASSREAQIAGGGTNLGSGYFGGFTGSTALPGSILFAQYNQSAVAAYLWGGNASNLTLAQLQALTGSLAVVMDGYSRSAASINLSGTPSFSSAAATIASALNATPTTEASITGSISGSTLTVSAVTAGQLAPGQTVTGTGAIGTGAVIVSQLTGSIGGTGTYSLSQTFSSISSQALTTIPTPLTVSYDSTSGAFVVTSGLTGAVSTSAFATGTLAAPLFLTQATGAVLSQGAAAASPASFMNGVIAVTTNWVTFMTAFDPDGGVGNTQKQAFAAWVNAQNNRYCYVCWDTDITPTGNVPATSSLGYILAQNGNSGTCLIYEPSDMNLAAFVCGAAASIDFEATNGRTTFAFRSQAGLVASVTTQTAAVNLGGNPQVEGSFGNGYNYYGAVGAANASFTWFQRGAVTGPYQWLDSYINQIWLNAQFQLALLNLQNNAKSIPYNTAGDSLIETALADPIAAGLNFGAYGPGTLSASQIAEVNSSAGSNIAPTLQTQGYYLQVRPTAPAAKQSRTSPPCTFWYLDNGSVQSLNLASIALT